MQEKGQVLLFLNRRGYSPTLLCHSCGWVVVCDHCDARLTLHQHSNRLICHHCGAMKSVPRLCQDCRQSELINLGIGTERIELVLKEHFPDEKILRIDRDTTRKKDSMQNYLAQVHNREVNILIGTQMIAKGHHFPALTLCVIIDADGGLFSVDFRALERMAQLLIQVAGRAGREERAGEVIIQTHHPEHPLLQCLLQEGYRRFSERVLRERAAVDLPPYGHLALIKAESVQREYSQEFLENTKQLAQHHIEKNNSRDVVKLLGPIPAPMERKAGRYRHQLLLQSLNRSALQALLKPLAQDLSQSKNSRKVRWSLDVDPQDVL